MVWTLHVQYCRGAATQDAQTSLLFPLQQPWLCHPFPLPPQWHPSFCPSTRRQRLADVRVRQNQAIRVPAHPPACRKPGMRTSMLNSSRLNYAVNPQPVTSRQDSDCSQPWAQGVFFPVCSQHSAWVLAASPRACVADVWLSRCIRVYPDLLRA